MLTARVGANAGEIYRYSGKVKISDNTVFIQGKQLDFIYYVLLNSNIKKLSFGTGQPLVKASELKEQKLFMPTSDRERKQIGECFRNLDYLITLHQRKLESLKQLKQAYLQQMFPANDEKVPLIRFENFSGEWEQRKLRELSLSFEYGLNAAAKEFDGQNKYIRITDIDDSSHEFLTERLTSPDANLSAADNYKLAIGDILFARTGASVGKTYIYKDSDGLVYYAGFLIRARIKGEINSEFVFQNTLTENYTKYMAITSQRSGQPGVNAQEYSDYTIKIPNRKEQDRIGAFLRSLDSIITLHQKKNDCLKKIKSIYLKSMFI